MLIGDRQGAQLMNVNSRLLPAEVLGFISEHATTSVVLVAIDAPLIICNREGLRGCERLIGHRYGARHGACHASNLTLYPEAASVRLARQLARQGFKHAVDPSPNADRIMLEAYPHPAFLELFDLATTIKYKKGKLAARRDGQRAVQRHLAELSGLTPPLKHTPMLLGLLATDLDSLHGTALKANEDALDAILCAYIAYYYWFWHPHRVLTFGNLDSGYIIVPNGSPSLDGTSADN